MGFAFLAAVVGAKTCACSCSSVEAPSRRARPPSTSWARSVVTAPEQLRQRPGELSGGRLARAAARLRPGADVSSAVLQRLGRRVERLGHEAEEVDRRLLEILTEVAPALLAECGVGPVCAAQLLVSSGDRKRMASEAPFAALAGTNPLEASSGQQRLRRLNRGDRQLNRALHVIALARIHHHPETAAYYQRLLAAGKTAREARRRVKRALARYCYRCLREIPTPALTT